MDRGSGLLLRSSIPQAIRPNGGVQRRRDLPQQGPITGSRFTGTRQKFLCPFDHPHTRCVPEKEVNEISLFLVLHRCHVSAKTDRGSVLVNTFHRKITQSLDSGRSSRAAVNQLTPVAWTGLLGGR
jgi:hypothetical protein